MSLANLVQRGLPLNRSDDFYTSTVLPMLVCANDFAYFERLTELVGLGPVPVDGDPRRTTIEFFTNYRFVDSLAGSARTRFPDTPRDPGVQSVVAFVGAPRRTLIGIECVMFERPSPEIFQDRVHDRATLMDYIASRLAVRPANVGLAALLPGRVAGEFSSLGIPVITWEQVLAAFGEVGPRYFAEMLRLALEHQEELAAKPRRYGAEAQSRMSGLELYERYNDGTLAAPWMQREGGLLGSKLQEDIDADRWREQRYDCRSKHLKGNPDWFTVADFVALIDVLDKASPANVARR